jgi:hypothetical protein
VTCWRILSVVVAVLASALPRAALAQASLSRDASTTPARPPEPPPATVAPDAQARPPDAPACFPSCRDGYTCYQGQCISQCNPPCPAGLECVEGRRCEPPLPGARAAGPAYEPPPPREKTFAELSHALIAFHWGFPSSLDVDGRSLDLDSTYGVMFRADSPVAKYVLLGPQLQFGSWRPETNPSSDHSYFIDFDFVIRFRAPITTQKLNYQLWLGMPVGISVGLPPQSASYGVGIGWNIGVLFGGAVHFTSKFGMFAEGGWEQHRIAHSQEKASDVDLKLQQPLMNIGFIVRN